MHGVRRLTGLAALALAAFLGTVGAATPASAHARVVSTSPGEGATVTGAVTRIVIRFDDVVTLVPHALTVTTDAGVPVGLETPRIVGGKTLMAFVQDHLAPGRYAVGWRILADDGHLESESFTFTVAGGPAHEVPATGNQPAPPAPGQPIWPVLVAAGLALAGGIGAGVAVRRGLRIVEFGAPYPSETGGRVASRLPM